MQVKLGRPDSYWHGVMLEEKCDAPLTPEDWTGPTKFSKVAFDIGTVAWVRTSKVKKLKTPSIYERARADLPAFLRELLADPVEARAIKLSLFGGGSTSSLVNDITTADGVVKVITNDHVPRYLALLNELDRPAALEWLLTLVESFNGVNGAARFDIDVTTEEIFNPKDWGNVHKGDFESVINVLLGTIGQLLLERAHEGPIDSARTAFGDDFADRLTAVLATLGQWCRMQPFIALTIEGFPGKCDTRRNQLSPFSTDFNSEQFGIAGETIPVIDGR